MSTDKTAEQKPQTVTALIKILANFFEPDCTKCKVELRQQIRQEVIEEIRSVASFTVKLEGNTVIVDKQDWDRLWLILSGEQKGIVK